MTSLVLDTYTINVNFNVAKAGKQLKKLKNDAAKAFKSVPAVGGQSAKGLGGVAAPSVKVLGGVGAAFAAKNYLQSAIDQTVAYNKSLVDVRKTTGLSVEDTKALGKEVLALAQSTKGLDTTNLFEYSTIAGQMGMDNKKDILEFTKTLGELELATNLSGEAGALAIARIRTLTKTSKDEFRNIASAITFAGNKFETSERQIASTAKEVAKGGSLFDITASEAIGLATAMDVVGVEAAVAGSSTLKILDKMQSETEMFGKVIGLSGDAFAKEFKSDAVGTLKKVSIELAKLVKNGASANEIAADLDFEDVRVKKTFGQMITNSELFISALDGVDGAYKSNIALTNEVAAASESYRARLQASQEASKKLKIALGESELVEAYVSLKESIASVLDVMSNIPTGVYKSLGLFAIGAGGLKLFKLALKTLGFGGAIAGIGKLSGVFKTLAGVGAIGGVRLALKGLLNIFKLNPWGLAITGILTLISHWDSITSAIGKARDAVAKFFKADESKQVATVRQQDPTSPYKPKDYSNQFQPAGSFAGLDRILNQNVQIDNITVDGSDYQTTKDGVVDGLASVAEAQPSGG